MGRIISLRANIFAVRGIVKPRPGEATERTERAEEFTTEVAELTETIIFCSAYSANSVVITPPSLRPLGFSQRVPMANTADADRTYMTPSESAGVAMRSSPIRFVAISRNSRPAATTSISPSSFER
jgi:hypothetical protein